MKLYQGMGPNSYRVRIFMAEKGIDLPMVDVDFAKAEHRAPAFLALNSLGQIPVLELDDGTVITESVAICRYLERRIASRSFSAATPSAAPRWRCGTGAPSW